MVYCAYHAFRHRCSDEHLIKVMNIFEEDEATETWAEASDYAQTCISTLEI